MKEQNDIKFIVFQKDIV